MGRSMHLFMKTLINPAFCQLIEVDSEMETLTDNNTITLKLYDNYGEPHYMDTNINSEELRQ